MNFNNISNLILPSSVVIVIPTHYVGTININLSNYLIITIQLIEAIILDPEALKFFRRIIVLHFTIYCHAFNQLLLSESAWDSGCVLVHCKVGVSRSTTFAVAFLMCKYQVIVH